MAGIRVTLESDLHVCAARGARVLEHGMRHAVQTAIDEGVKQAKNDHPYTDRTGDLTKSIHGYVETSDQNGAEGVFLVDEEYASWVDSGTSRAKAYPFAGPAYLKMERVLERELAIAAAATEAEIDR